MTNADIVPELTSSKFDEFIKDKGFVLIDFFAEWCMPCLVMAPVIDELSEKFRKKIKFGKVNVDDSQKLAQKFDIKSIPNFILFKDGKIVKQFFGSMSVEEFQEKLKKEI